ncbi:hypothetical protein AB0C27_28325 [Nonomuraea sp. NPDC048882]|uniref:hypothetical protein n=1 Tax=Nonomuraea sp. NPDC048882 TaxID=3154347 RepID=UPI00340A2CB0
MGLNAGLVPPRVGARVKAGLLELVADAACAGGWSTRQAAATLGLDHVRVLRRQVRAVLGRLDDARPGPEIALHALLPWEREAIVKIAGERLEIDRSHRELAHRGSRLDAFYASERAVRELMSLSSLELGSADQWSGPADYGRG